MQALLHGDHAAPQGGEESSAERAARMDLFLRKVTRPQAHPYYRVVLRDYIPEVEIGSIGVQQAAGARKFWRWQIDTMVPMHDLEVRGVGQDRQDCMRKFREAWERFSADPARLSEFLAMSRNRRLNG